MKYPKLKEKRNYKLPCCGHKEIVNVNRYMKITFHTCGNCGANMTSSHPIKIGGIRYA